jgi:hypothetical protein
MENLTNLNLLKNLFDECRDDDHDSEDERENADENGIFNLRKKSKGNFSNTVENSLITKIEPNSDMNIQSVDDLEVYEESFDSREQPSYLISYKQQLTAEDCYLQMGLKTPATSSCEFMIIEIMLPLENSSIDQFELDVKEEEIILKTRKYKLQTQLPHKISPQKSSAKYDCGKKKLTLSLKMDRPYDFINF